MRFPANALREVTWHDIFFRLYPEKMHQTRLQARNHELAQSQKNNLSLTVPLLLAGLAQNQEAAKKRQHNKKQKPNTHTRTHTGGHFMEKNFCIFRNMQENRGKEKEEEKKGKTLPGSLSSCKCVVIFSNCMQKEERKIRRER